MLPSTLRPLKQHSRSITTITTTFFLFLCIFLILFPVGVVSAIPVVPLALVPAASSSASASASNAAKSSNTNITLAPAAAQEQYQQQQQQAPNKTMYGSEEQPAVENHQAAAGADSSKQQSQPQQLSHRDPIYMWSSLAAGVGSGALASMLCAPLDLVRTRMQVWGQVVRNSKGAAAGAAASAKSLSLPGMLRDIIQRDGWRGCFRGLGATLVTVPTFWGVYCKLVLNV
jgi:hypothetical protein